MPELSQRTKDLAKRYNINPAKERGQHFLIDEKVLQDMIKSAELSADDTVVEIGPGLGTLTEQLLQSGAMVIAAEIDRRFQKLLRQFENLYKKKFILRWGDALKYSPSELLTAEDKIISDYKIVASLPYNISAKFFRHFLWQQPLPKTITVLVQAEVAERVCAAPGRMSLLSLVVQLVGKPKIVRYVEALSFWPEPQVRSAILHINILSDQLLNAEEEKNVWQTARIGFSARRKQLKNNLAGGFHLSVGKISDLLEKNGISVQARPQDLTIEQWLSLSKDIVGIVEPH